MRPYKIRQVPWTCEWGRFGVATEDLGPVGLRVDDVFWLCHHPTRSPHFRLTARGQCERCPFWEKATQTPRRVLAAPRAPFGVALQWPQRESPNHRNARPGQGP